MDIWAQLWPTSYIGGKVHKKVVSGLIRRIGLFTRFETIYALVELSGITDECDKLATSRAIRDVRDNWRKSYIPGLKAISS